ncbi:MAG: ABC transporter permease [Flavobacteriaceae bacterium CG_4_8_14_3_um_filter_34_10]|nr:iron ABC transporter permease [Flavobacteriia bacterium]PIQ18531.1 MAG: ABC transporter permease [Flavobacteriaceae bacterium CG18_big_fil_WC_8_21_14_2_50_34_36]PIV49815.1 MAG: ABC transporter permease [Flavobacteriaceae bacterium CG02_land_8_20_14_3_00_34_13]PIX08778.1 MAG: ABC transporter permease [Flavobacteriaceae bacterium CG_4_8_14_3_um_filter_34_10]PIZ07095.1 MAG: ABC transporter permease [Flavobacteriaceae bacterium CG_4_10_14_0_8_um_filter_34_31]PJC06066.1 MAG: ABC transporter perm
MKQVGSSTIFSFKNRLFRLKRDSNRWSIITLVVVFLIALPVFSIAVKLFDGPGETWSHIVEHLLFQYVSNSFYLLIVCSILVLLFGVTSAWLISRFEFPFRKQLEWLLILPLAIPSYIVAYAYAGIFDYGGTLELIQRFFGLQFTRIDIMNRFGLAFVLSVSLFPYVYVSSRAFFLNQANNLLEASRVLGVKEWHSFFKLILPLARPAIIAGLILVLMEVLNDYGAATYFGVSTFTTGIFRSWFSLEEPETAIYLSALLVLLVFALILFEKWQRRHIRFANTKSGNQRIYRKKVSKKMQLLILVVVSFPVLFGFLLPLVQLFYWGFLTYKAVFEYQFLLLSLQTFGIAFITATFTVIFATLLIFSAKWNKIGVIKNISRLGVLGYAIPGAVVAIGVMIPILFIDKWLIGVLNTLFSYSSGFLIHGTLIALVYAYVIRFLAVAYNPIESTTLKVSDTIPDASKTLGVGNFKTFFKIEFPLIKTGILSAFILVFIDVLKELPLTLILKPFHINTLAVKAFEYASDERVMEAAIPSLFIIFTAMIPVLFLNRLLAKKIK